MPATHTGNDVQMSIIVAGAVLFECAVVDFSEDDNYDEQRLDLLGDCDAILDQNFQGHSGSMTVVEKDQNLRRLRDYYLANVAARGPQLNVVISVDRVYPDGSNYPYRYEYVQLTFSSSDQKNAPSQTTVNWSTTHKRVNTLGPLGPAFPLQP